MKIHLTEAHETEVLALFEARAVSSKEHELVADPGMADLILILGSFGLDPRELLDHPAYKAFPERCAVYTEDDNYMPLAPGVYCSAHRDEHARAGRTFSYSYVSRNGRYQNPYLAETPSATPKIAAEERRFLFTFQGGSTSLLRKRLFNVKFDRPDVLIENTSKYYHWDDSQPDRRNRQLAYAETVTASHFVLCPRGAGVGTIRLFEVMASGVAPVLLSDDYELPPGPAWETFLLRVPERDIAKLPALLEAHVASAAERGRLAREAFIAHFSVEREFDRVIELAARSLRHGPPPEEQFRKQQAALIRRVERKRKLRGALRTLVLKTLKVLRLKNPYQMNR
jgi:Exostosin family